MNQVQLQTRLWITQTRIAANVQLRMLLCKVDTCIEQAEHKVSEQQKQIHTLLRENEQLYLQLDIMVNEKNKCHAKIGELNDVICSAQEQIRNLSNSLKVPLCFKK